MTPLHLSQIGVYNPGRLTDDALERTFVARKKQFEQLLKRILDALAHGGTPQHQLLIGQRGMGKSSMLLRVAVELRKAPHRTHVLPLVFPEEQYNIDRLGKFWLNCLDALADALDREGHELLTDALDRQIAGMRAEVDVDNGRAIFEQLQAYADQLGRRLVLLVDNMNLLFDGLGKSGQHGLRALLMRPGAPLVVGASSVSMDQVDHYDAPWYDAFRQTRLRKISFDEARTILLNLAQQTGATLAERSFLSHEARLRTLYTLTGGSPRTLVLLFPLVQGGLSEDIQTDLESLLDAVTPLYKARFDELAPQVQILLDAVAIHWHPIDLEGLRTATSLANNQISPQLKRLVETGWLQKLENPDGRGKAYEVSERFFNIWYLMRRSSRRQRRELLCLTRFLEVFYGNADYLNSADEAQRVHFNAEHTNGEILATIPLRRSLSALHAEQYADFKTYLSEALAIIDDALPITTADDWHRFAAVVLRREAVSYLEKVFDETGVTVRLRPYLEAIRAIRRGNVEQHLNTIAAELRLPARQIAQDIQRIMGHMEAASKK